MSELIGVFRAEIQTAAYPNFREMKWSKRLLNLFASATSAILKLPPDDFIKDPRLFDIDQQALREALCVMRELRYRPVAFPGYPVGLHPAALAAPLRFVRPLLVRFLARGQGTSCPRCGGASTGAGRSARCRSSTAPRSGKARLGIPTPMNESLASMVQGLAAGRLDWGRFRQDPAVLVNTIAGTSGRRVSTGAAS